LRAIYTLFLILALCLPGWAQAEEKQEPQDVKSPQNVEQSIEALFGPDEEEETEKQQPSDEDANEPLLYISDTDNGRIVVMQGMRGRGFTSVGLPGFGYGRFLRPSQIWVDYEKRLYVADTGNNRVIRVDQTKNDGWTEFGDLTTPRGIAVDKSGVYVAETDADRVVRLNEVSAEGKVEETLTHPQLNRPTTLWIDSEGALYICSGEDPPGGKIFKTWMEKERRRWEIFKGDGLSGSRFRPSAVVTTGSNLRFLDDSGERLVVMQNMEGRRMKALPFRNERRWRLDRPRGLAVDESGQRLFIADSGNDRILEVRADGSVVAEFRQLEDDIASALRNPGSIFVFSPAPAPEPEEDEEEEDE